MSKPVKKRLPASPDLSAPATKLPTPRTSDQKSLRADQASKQSRVITMLSSAKGATIDAMMKITGWQQHSVRGFLAGVVRKRLKLNLDSAVVDGTRVYHVSHLAKANSGASRGKRR